MIFPYITQRIRRKPLAAVLLFLLNFATALLMCILHVSSIRMYEQIDQVYENATVTCQVSNITGTQVDDLFLPEWVVRMFLGKEGVPNSEGISYSMDENAERFRTYIDDVYAKVSIKGTYNGAKIKVVGITDRAADRALQPEYGCEITWKEGYDDDIFSGTDACCLISETMLPALAGAESLSVSFSDDERTTTKELRVVGTFTGSEDAIYCPWIITAQINQEIRGAVHANSIGAVFRDNRAIPAFWQEVASGYFVEPNAKGELTPWETSPIYSSFPFALLINDDVLEETVSRLEHNLTVFRLCTTAMIALSLILGFVVAHLIVRQRVKALALQRVLGQSNGSIFAETWLELTAATAAGIAVGTGICLLTGIRDFPWRALLASLGCYMIGTASAIFFIVRTDLIRSIKEDA